jgi:hypothetical protein
MSGTHEGGGEEWSSSGSEEGSGESHQFSSLGEEYEGVDPQLRAYAVGGKSGIIPHVKKTATKSRGGGRGWAAAAAAPVTIPFRSIGGVPHGGVSRPVVAPSARVPIPYDQPSIAAPPSTNPRLLKYDSESAADHELRVGMYNSLVGMGYSDDAAEEYSRLISLKRRFGTQYVGEVESSISTITAQLRV